jgi:aminoglycoside phosphotransferase family enzyme/predicted kinase
VVTEDQTSIIDFLGRPESHGGAAVERIETHASVVFLAGTRAYKLKRAVRFDYLDFSSVERRRLCCEAEVRLNRRTAPSIYRGVVPVTLESDGSYALGGRGTPRDWLVAMNRFPADGLFDRLAARGALDVDLMRPLADAIAAFHERAEHRVDHGGRAGMAWVIDGNVAGFEEFGGRMLDRAAIDRLALRSRDELARRALLLDQRRAAGFVRHCHGDLHLRNIVLLDGQPTLFDGVEFNDEIACTDILYDLAFLLMDLSYRGLPRHANVVWNRYLSHMDALDGLSLMPLFLSCRAAVRAKTNATSATLEHDDARRAAFAQNAQAYLSMAESFLEPPPPRLVAIGGLSGSGKSTLAAAIAPATGAPPGAVVLRSDEVRKELFGVALDHHLGPAAYASDVSACVYRAAVTRAVEAVRQGATAIVDAVFARPDDRAVVERAASAAGVPFLGVWLDAPTAVRLARTAARHGDASDADAAVAARQRAEDTGEITWWRLDAVAPIDRLSAAVTARLQSRSQ